MSRGGRLEVGESQDASVGGDEVGVAGEGGEGEGGAAVADGAFFAGEGADDGARQGSVGKVDVHFKVAACAQAADAAGWPCRGEGGEQVEATGVALQQHLGDAGCAAEVAVDLKWRVLGPEIVGSAVFQEV